MKNILEYNVDYLHAPGEFMNLNEASFCRRPDDRHD